MKKREKPNYRWWSNMEAWTFKQATLLLHGLDPNQHRSLKPYAYHLPAEYLPLQKTYLMLSQFPWKQLYPHYYFEDKGIHPVAIVFLAVQKKLPLPKRLKKIIIQRLNEENQHRENESDMQALLSTGMPIHNESSSPKIIQRNFGFTARERKNLLRILGILVKILFNEEQNSSRYQYADRLNSYQIAQSILEKAKKMGLSIQGLKSLDRKITEAIAILELK